MFAATRTLSPLAKAGMTSFRGTRYFASEAAPVVKKAGGAGIFQRITSFFVGAGLTAVVTQFYIFNEIQDGNKLMISKQKELESRLAKLEGKK